MKSKLINASLVSVLFLETALSYLLIHKTPLKFYFTLPEVLEVLAQSSKKNHLPSDYITVLGDSYAQGNGDCLMTADPNIFRYIFCR